MKWLMTCFWWNCWYLELVRHGGPLFLKSRLLQLGCLHNKFTIARLVGCQMALELLCYFSSLRSVNHFTIILKWTYLMSCNSDVQEFGCAHSIDSNALFIILLLKRFSINAYINKEVWLAPRLVSMDWGFLKFSDIRYWSFSSFPAVILFYEL